MLLDGNLKKSHHWSFYSDEENKIYCNLSKRFGFSPREEKVFNDHKEAEWFERAMKRSNYITNILEVKE